MNVYVRALSGALARAGVSCDIYTRSVGDEPPVVVAEPGVRVFAVAAGPREAVRRDQLPHHLPFFVRRVLETAEDCRRSYDMIHSHYWLSGEAARSLSVAWRAPFIHTFHSLGRVKNRRLSPGENPEPDGRLAGEDRVVSSATRLLASTRQEEDDLVDWYRAPGRCADA